MRPLVTLKVLSKGNSNSHCCTLNHKNYNAKLNKYDAHLYFENKSKWVMAYITRLRVATSNSFALFMDLIPLGYMMSLYIPLHVQMLSSRNDFEHVILFFFPASMTSFCLNDEEFQ